MEPDQIQKIGNLIGLLARDLVDSNQINHIQMPCFWQNGSFAYIAMYLVFHNAPRGSGD
jgi:hypothetical protein